MLPGLTFVMGVILILPFTYGMDPETGIILMLAVYVAGTYGGAITSILLHIPGEPNNVPLLWDGYTMTRQGRAAEALGWAAFAALAWGLVAWVLLTFAARPIAQVALKFGQAEYFVIVLLGLTSVLALAERSVVKSLAALLIGMLLATVGVDDVYGTVRFDFGSDVLRDGVDYLPVMVGIYALGHVLVRFGERFSAENAPAAGSGEDEAAVASRVPRTQRQPGTRRGHRLPVSVVFPVRRDGGVLRLLRSGEAVRQGPRPGGQRVAERCDRSSGRIDRDRRRRLHSAAGAGNPRQRRHRGDPGRDVAAQPAAGPADLPDPARARLHHHRGAVGQRDPHVRVRHRSQAGRWCACSRCPSSTSP